MTPDCESPLMGQNESARSNTIGAIKLALEFRDPGRADDILDVIARLVRPFDPILTDTVPTRLLVEAIKIERTPS